MTYLIDPGQSDGSYASTDGGLSDGIDSSMSDGIHHNLPEVTV